jgi:hypothetical protein
MIKVSEAGWSTDRKQLEALAAAFAEALAAAFAVCLSFAWSA